MSVSYEWQIRSVYVDRWPGDPEYCEALYHYANNWNVLTSESSVYWLSHHTPLCCELEARSLLHRANA